MMLDPDVSFTLLNPESVTGIKWDFILMKVEIKNTSVSPVKDLVTG